MTRNQIDVTKRYAELVGLGSARNGRTAILDGELLDRRVKAWLAGIDPCHLTTARRELPSAGDIEEIDAPTRGGA